MGCFVVMKDYRGYFIVSKGIGVTRYRGYSMNYYLLS